ncbi:MAG: hypothetical protein MRY21_06755 [Simkaniaceae bacterium]|nr:hypothetical protein [Simkaniaceae bacterium]
MADLPQGPVPSPDRIDPNKPVEGSDQMHPGNDFGELMNKPSGQPMPGEQASQAAQKPSPAELTQQQPMQTGTPTQESLNSQIKASSATLGDLQTKMNTPNLRLKSSQRYLLRQKLGDANSQIRSAASQAGVQLPAPPKNISRQNPVARFLSMISDSQEQLNQTSKSINDLADSGKPINPAKMLMMQVRLGKAQQQLEYSSIILSKAVDDIKLMFNVQL